jgi:hypothetical protein
MVTERGLVMVRPWGRWEANAQFFFDPELAVVGFADKIISPAFLAVETSTSWIS